MLTVFTPTYNRAKLLFRLYKSLCNQTCKDFEWLIIDDGSVDDTRNVVAEFIKQNVINIRYIKKKNGGKHTAHNLALNEAKGELFFCVDSDDWLENNSIENILRSADDMHDTDYALFGYKSLENGKLLCTEFPENVAHKGFYQIVKSGAGGEYSIVMKKDIIKKYSFPEVAGEHFSTEAILYDLMELKGYTVCPCNAVLTICEYQKDGLSENIIKCLKQSPTAYQIFHSQRIDLVDTLKERFIHALKYHAFKALSRNKEYFYRGKHKWLIALTYFPGAVCSFYYKFK